MALPDGCYSGLEPASRATATLTALGKRCAGGMKPIGDVTVAKPEHGKLRVPFDVDNSPACVRILAASADAPRIELELHDPRGILQASEGLDAPFGVLPRLGPVCVTERGRYRITAVAKTDQPVAVRVFVGSDEE